MSRLLLIVLLLSLVAMDYCTSNCVDTRSWALRAKKVCKNCNCKQIRRFVQEHFQTHLCSRDQRSKKYDIRMRQACCKLCKQRGYPYIEI